MSEQLNGKDLWSRRFFIKSSLVGMALLGSRLAFPQSAWSHSLPEGQLQLYNLNTHERLRVKYRNASGRYDHAALTDLNYFLRCPHTNQVCKIDLQLLEFVNQVEKMIGKGKEIRIFSAYRSPSYNNLLVRLGRGAAPQEFAYHWAGCGYCHSWGPTLPSTPSRTKAQVGGRRELRSTWIYPP